MTLDPQEPTSHPAIRFARLPIVDGPLSRIDRIRPQILDDVVRATLASFENDSSETLLSEALHAEQNRLKRERRGLFNRRRLKRDRILWSDVKAQLLSTSSEAERRQCLEKVVRHYAEEIGGHFSPGVYRFATSVVPWAFSWLLNVASVRHFLPWRMPQSLRSRLHIVGEVDAIQKLSKTGTILLVPTHQSNIDSIVVAYVIYLMGLPAFSYGAGLNLFTNPVLNFFMSRLGAYTVDRKKTNALYKRTLKNYSTEILSRGVHSVFFPGGGRSRSGSIENKLKLGLLGTGIEASRESPVYVVPMVISYHFVLEAASLIEDHLAEEGKHRFIIMDDDFSRVGRLMRFFWRLFSTSSGLTVRIGKPLDAFGNLVDEEGRSKGLNVPSVESVLSSPEKHIESTRELGCRLAERYRCENVVLTSHAVAFVFFETLKRKFSELDLFHLLRISLEQRAVPVNDFLDEASRFYRHLAMAAEQGRLHVSPEFNSLPVKEWVADGIRNIGVLHDVAVVRERDGHVVTEDMNLLYYYRNRLTGYGFEDPAAGGTYP